MGKTLFRKDVFGEGRVGWLTQKMAIFPGVFFWGGIVTSSCP